MRKTNQQTNVCITNAILPIIAK